MWQQHSNKTAIKFTLTKPQGIILNSKSNDFINAYGVIPKELKRWSPLLVKI
ncbi:MAG: hypothetical protein ACI892_002137, partial [Marinobacter maritimus]